MIVFRSAAATYRVAGSVVDLPKWTQKVNSLCTRPENKENIEPKSCCFVSRTLIVSSSEVNEKSLGDCLLDVDQLSCAITHRLIGSMIVNDDVVYHLETTRNRSLDAILNYLA